MYKQKIVWLLLLFLLIQQPAESRCCRSHCGQPINHGKLISRSNGSLLESKKRAVIQTKAIDQYMKVGQQLEAQKKWPDAERSFRYVLQVVSLRDGPGSFNSKPALEHLATVTKAQNKLDEAIDFQEKAMLLEKAQSKPNQQAVLSAQSTLADLLMQKQDYRNAASILKDSITMYDTQPSLPQNKRLVTYQHYAKVLRQLHKDSEADSIQALVDANSALPEAKKSAENKQIVVEKNEAHTAQ